MARRTVEPPLSSSPMGSLLLPSRRDRRDRTTICSTDQFARSAAAAREDTSRSYTCAPMGAALASVAIARRLTFILWEKILGIEQIVRPAYPRACGFGWQLNAPRCISGIRGPTRTIAYAIVETLGALGAVLPLCLAALEFLRHIPSFRAKQLVRTLRRFSTHAPAGRRSSLAFRLPENCRAPTAGSPGSLIWCPHLISP